jgi:hypothetical protein
MGDVKVIAPFIFLFFYYINDAKVVRERETLHHLR